MHQIKVFCPGCNVAYLTTYTPVVMPRDLDSFKCANCGGDVEVDTVVPNEKVKVFHTKTKDKIHNSLMKKAERFHKIDRMKQFKRAEDYKD